MDPSDNFADLRIEVKNILKEFGKENNICSINLVGSFGGENNISKKVNDFDILIINDDISASFLRDLECIMIDVEEKFSNENLELDHSFIIGPQKLSIKDNKANVLLHNLVYKKRDFLKESNLVRTSWLEWHDPIYGKELRFINGYIPEVPEIHLKDVINSRFGISDCLVALEQRKLIAHEWKNLGDNSVELRERYINIGNNTPFYGEMLVYSAIYSTLNFVRAKNGIKVKKEDSQKRIYELIELKDDRLFDDITSFKNKIRMNPKSIQQKEISDFRYKIVSLLEQIKAQIIIESKSSDDSSKG